MLARGTVARLTAAIAFQVLWFALVFSAGTAWSAVVFAATALVTLLVLALATTSFRGGVLFVGLAGACGATMDTLLTGLGVLAPARWIVPFPVTPLWLIGLWLAFAAFLKITLVYLRKRPVTQWALGAIGGPLAYWSGARLGALALAPNLPVALTVLALAWGGMCVLLFVLVQRFERHER